MKKVYSKIPIAIKDEHQVAFDHWVIWCSLLDVGKYASLLNRGTGPMVGYILDGKRKVWFCRYGFINDSDIWAKKR